MRIVVLVNNSMRYDERVKRQIQHFTDAGHQVEAIGVLTEKDLDTPALPQIENARFHLVERRKRKNYKNWLSASVPHKMALVLLKFGIKGNLIRKFVVCTTYLPLFHYVKKIRADLYYANDLDTTGVAMDVSKRMKAGFIYDAHEYYYGQSSSAPLYLREAVEIFESTIVQNASSCITVSGSIANRLSQKYNIKPPTVIRNIGTYIKVKEPKNVNDPVRLLYQSANLDLYGRNLKTLVDAVARLDNVTLTLRGNIEKTRKTVLLAYLKKFLKDGQFELRDAVPYKIMIEEASKFDVGFILNSPDNENHQLTLPNKIFEYMNAGLALVCFNTLELAKIVGGYKVGAVCPENYPIQLAETIKDLVEDRKKLLTMKKRSYELARTEFNWTNEKKQFDKILPN